MRFLFGEVGVPADSPESIVPAGSPESVALERPEVRDQGLAARLHGWTPSPLVLYSTETLPKLQFSIPI